MSDGPQLWSARYSYLNEYESREVVTNKIVKRKQRMNKDLLVISESFQGALGALLRHSSGKEDVRIWSIVHNGGTYGKELVDARTE